MYKKFILKENVLFYDETIFGDDFEHEYNVKCYNGYAIAKRVSDNENEPSELKLTYPKRAEVIKDKELAHKALDYFGFSDLTIKDINYGDIMIYFGEIKEVIN